MKILGNRLLVSRVEEEQKEGFKTIEVQDNFVYKGRIAMVGDDGYTFSGTSINPPLFSVGDVVLFAKYSPDTQEIDHEGKMMKIINQLDVLAIL